MGSQETLRLIQRGESQAPSLAVGQAEALPFCLNTELITAAILAGDDQGRLGIVTEPIAKPAMLHSAPTGASPLAGGGQTAQLTQLLAATRRVGKDDPPDTEGLGGRDVGGTVIDEDDTLPVSDRTTPADSDRYPAPASSSAPAPRPPCR